MRLRYPGQGTVGPGSSRETGDGADACLVSGFDQVSCSACWPGVRRRASEAEPALTPGRGGAQRSRLDLNRAQFGSTAHELLPFAGARVTAFSLASSSRSQVMVLTGCQVCCVADLRAIVRRRSLTSTVVDGDCYSVGYSPFAMPIRWSRLRAAYVQWLRSGDPILLSSGSSRLCLLIFLETCVAVPDFQSLMRPCLVVHQDRKPHTPTDLRDRLAAQMHVSAEDRTVMLPSGRQSLFSNRVAWAVTHLAQAGLLDRPARGVTQITDRGGEVLTRYPNRVDMKVLRQFPEYEEFRTRTKQRKDQSPSMVKDNGISREDLSPREAIEDVIDSAHSAVAADLLARVLKQSPAFLEQLVLRLLVKMGYGGLETPAEHLGAPGDAGLDATP